MFGLLHLPWYNVSSDLLMDQSDSKKNIKVLILFLVLPAGICSLLGALCMRQQEKRPTMSTVGLVLMAVLTLACLTVSLVYVSKGKCHLKFAYHGFENFTCIHFQIYNQLMIILFSFIFTRKIFQQKLQDLSKVGNASPINRNVTKGKCT